MSQHTEQRRLEQAAGQWFVRMRGPSADTLRDRFETWMAEPAHRMAYERIAAQFDLGAQLDPAAFADLRRAGRSKTPGIPPLAPWGVALAACLIAAVTVLGLGHRLAAPPAALAEGRYATGVGEIRTVQLAPGAVMTLDTDSVVVAATQAGRSVLRLEQGRVRLAIAPQARGLRVEAGPLRLTSGVSRFDLARTAAGQVDVALISGRLDLAAIGDEGRPAPKGVSRLDPGQHLTLAADHGFTSPAPTPGADQAWPSGMRTFERAPLGQVIAEANRYSTAKIRLRDPALGALQVSGTFRVTDGAALARALAAAFGLVVFPAPGGDLVLARQTG